MKTPAKRIVARQYGAIPFRIVRKSLEVLLITSRDTGRWLVPKGWPIPKLKPRQVAAREAWEEAGVRGSIVGKAIGRYRYMKAIEDDLPIECELTLFALRVKRQSKSWPEKGQRRTEWFDVPTAVTMVKEPGLIDLLQRLAATLRPKTRAEGEVG